MRISYETIRDRVQSLLYDHLNELPESLKALAEIGLQIVRVLKSQDVYKNNDCRT
jgi:hypothetical protein